MNQDTLNMVPIEQQQKFLANQQFQCATFNQQSNAQKTNGKIFKGIKFFTSSKYL